MKGLNIKKFVNTGSYILGEYTTGNGPFSEDYFLALINNRGETMSFPVGSKEAKFILEQLDLSENLSLRLNNSVENSSRIILPVTLEGESFLDFSLVNQGLIKSILNFGLQEERLGLNEVALNYLELKSLCL